MGKRQTKNKKTCGYIEIQCAIKFCSFITFFFFHFHTFNGRAWPVACSTVLHDGSLCPFYFDTWILSGIKIINCILKASVTYRFDRNIVHEHVYCFFYVDLTCYSDFYNKYRKRFLFLSGFTSLNVFDVCLSHSAWALSSGWDGYLKRNFDIQISI